MNSFKVDDIIQGFEDEMVYYNNIDIINKDKYRSLKTQIN